MKITRLTEIKFNGRKPTISVKYDSLKDDAREMKILKEDYQVKHVKLMTL